jgi:23S rRNA pseudouridine1911/1915/1917 synthase
MENLYNIQITLNSLSNGLRIDLFVSLHLKRSRSYCSKLIEKGMVLVNGSTCKNSYRLKLNDLVQIFIPEEKVFTINPTEIDFDVIYENERYVVINKPSNVVVHPACGNWDNTLAGGLVYKYGRNFDKDDIRPGIIHRLDKDTSGVLIMAKDSQAKSLLSKLFYDKKIKKIYHAICVGLPAWSSKVIDAPVGRHPKNRKIMAVVDGGKQAKSIVKVIKQFKDVFLAEIELITGRTHQIRVHMKHIGLPVLGDLIYGIKSSKNHLINRQALHAYFISFLDPFDNIIREFVAPYPDDLKDLIAKLNQDM